MSTAGLFPWLQLERQTKTPGVGTPAQDLVKSLIGIQERRDIKERLKREEERQARLDLIEEEKRRRTQEWEDFERKQKIAAQTSGLEKATQEILSNIVPMAMGNGEQPAPPPSEREKVTTKTGPDGSQTVSVDRPLPIDQTLGVPVDTNPEVMRRLNPESVPLDQLDLGGGPQTPGVPEVLPLQERMTQEILRRKAPMTASYQGQTVELPYMEDALRRKYMEALVSPSAVSAERAAQFRETPEERAAREASNLDQRFENQRDLLEMRLAALGNKAPKTRVAWDKKLQSARPITDSEWNSEPERYTDITTGRKTGETGAGRSAAVAGLIGSPDEAPDSLSIWSTVRRINKGNTDGISSRFRGVKQRFEGALGYDLDVKTYLDQLGGMSSMIAKEFGESGRLSDQDITRTKLMFPMPGETEAETERKMQNIYSVIQYAQSGGRLSDQKPPEMLLGSPPPPPGFTEPVGQ